MNALTFALVGLIFLFTVPKIYQVYQVRLHLIGKPFHLHRFVQVPIDRTAKQILDQANQVLSKYLFPID